MEKNPIHIRDAYANERDVMRDITLAAYEEYATTMPPLFWKQYRQVVLRTLEDSGAAERIVAEQDGEIIGSVLLYPAKASAYNNQISLQEPEVRSLAVLPTMRGHGIGKALMEECIQRARRAGAKALGLHTMEVMQAAIHMYERMGFVRVPERDFGPTEEILVMGYSRALDDANTMPE